MKNGKYKTKADSEMSKEKTAMSTPRDRTYLGDGLYAEFDGYWITLSAPREHDEHYVALEPSVFDALLQYAKQIGWLQKGQKLS